MHNQDISHRDLKPENIMVDIIDNEPIVKLIDFGFAAQSEKKLQIFCGTPAYMSPELVGQGSYNGTSADMWAAGIILF